MKGVYSCVWIVIMLMITCSPKKKDGLPNIVFILADDLGYGDLGCYNDKSLVPTPNLDQLASEGIKLSNAYCPVSVCSPTRYVLMTGRYPWRSWRKSGVMRNYEPSMIDEDILTLPEMLQRSGYTTAGFGKWHLGTTFPTTDGEEPAGYGQFRADDNGANIDLKQPVSDGPTDHGFNHWLGFSCASETWILENNMIIGAIGHDLYTIEATSNKEDIDIIPLEDYLPYLTGKASAFLDSYSDTNYSNPFFLYFAPYVPHIPLSVNEEFKGSTQAGLYGDYVHELDFYIGQLLKKLDALGYAKNTLVLFASDNGSQFLLTGPDLDLANATNNPIDIVNVDTLSGHRPNGSLRGTKWSIYEGGVRTPMIAKWPDHFQVGVTLDGIFGLNDVWMTLANIVDSPISDNSTAVDSKSQYQMFMQHNNEIRREIVMQSSGMDYALRDGSWKYIYRFNTKEAELYDLGKDEGESKNLIKSFPDIGQKMHKQLHNILAPDINLE